MIFSVIVSTRNRDKTLYQLLKSLNNQDFSKTDYEVIVVNYGGQSNTRKVVESFNKSNFIYVYVSEEGMFNESHSKNIGIRKANGEVIICTNADIIFDKDVLKRFKKLYLSTKGKYLYQLKRFDLPEDFNVKKNFKNLLNNKYDYDKFPKQDETAVGDFQAAKRNFWFKVRGYDELMTGWGRMDIDLADRFLKMGVKQKWMNEKKIRIYHQFHLNKAPSRNTINNQLRIANSGYKVNTIKWGDVGRFKKIVIAIFDQKNTKSELKLFFEYLKNQENIEAIIVTRKTVNTSAKQVVITENRYTSFFQKAKKIALQKGVGKYFEINELMPSTHKKIATVIKNSNRFDLVLADPFAYTLPFTRATLKRFRNKHSFNLRLFDMRLAKLISLAQLNSLHYLYVSEILNISKDFEIEVLKSRYGKKYFQDITMPFTLIHEIIRTAV